jgi:hypothetical protein
MTRDRTAGGRYRRLRRIESLDPARDYREIVELFYLDFQAVMMLQAVTGNLFTFAIPRIARILVQSGQFEHQTGKRVVDTILLAQTVIAHGFEPGPGRDAARRVNAMHRQYEIHPDDFIGVGCDIAVMSVAIAERFGWREVTAAERTAMALFEDREARVFGSHQALPATLEEMLQYWEQYVSEQARYEPGNEQLARAFLAYLPQLFPPGLGKPVVALLVAQVDPRILRACGLPVPSAARKRISAAALRALGASGPGRDPRPGERNPIEKLADRLYPHGWSVQTLGTHLTHPHLRGDASAGCTLATGGILRAAIRGSPRAGPTACRAGCRLSRSLTIRLCLGARPRNRSCRRRRSHPAPECRLPDRGAVSAY